MTNIRFVSKKTNGSRSDGRRLTAKIIQFAMALPMMLGAEPADIERFCVIVVVGMDIRGAAAFARLSDESAVPNSVTDAIARMVFFGLPLTLLLQDIEPLIWRRIPVRKFFAFPSML